jgi:O-antigen ligase
MIVVFYPPMQRPFTILSGETSPWYKDFTETVAEGGAMREIQFTLLGLVALGRLAFRRTGQSVRVPPNALGWLFAGLAVLMVASVLWSDEPMFTVRRVVALAMVGLAAFAYRSMPGEEFLRLVFFTTLAGLAFGLAKEGALGSFHPWDPEYRFKGTLPHPNIQGWNCALVFLSGLSLVHALRRWRPALVLVFPLAGLFLTRSRTSVAALLGAALFYAFLSLLRTRPLVLAAALCLAATAVVSAVWIVQTSPGVEDAAKLGREDSNVTTLEGRTEIWEEALVYVRARPWLGYGYDSFWSAKQIEEFSGVLGWRIPNAHSNYLDVLLGLGGIGLFIFVCILWVGIRRASRVAVESGNTADLFTATLLVFCALHGFLETTIVGPSFLTLLYMIAVVRLGFPAGAPSESGPPIENRR